MWNNNKTAIKKHEKFTDNRQNRQNAESKQSDKYTKADINDKTQM